MEGKKSITKETVVTKEKLALNVGSGSLEVYATPMVIALMENAAAELAQGYIDSDCTTVGTGISIAHTSATPLGAKVRATAELLNIDGRKFSFAVTAFDDAGEIARGTHERFSVKSESFQKKTDNKFNL